MSTYDAPEAREDRLYRRLLNDTYVDMDELRLRYDAQTRLVEALEAQVDALQRLDTVATALVIARDVMIAQERQIERLVREDTPSPVALAREMSVVTGVPVTRSRHDGRMDT